MKSPHSKFLGWDHYARDLARRLEAASAAGHPEWVELPATFRNAKGEGKYFTGKPCKNGHISPRYSMGKSMFDWAKNISAQCEPYAVEYVENLLPIGITLTILVGIIFSIYYAIEGWRRKDDPAINDGIIILKLGSKTAAAFSLPVAPALGLSAIYPNLLSMIEGIQPAMIIAAFILFWAGIRALKE